SWKPAPVQRGRQLQARRKTPRIHRPRRAGHDKPDRRLQMLIDRTCLQTPFIRPVATALLAALMGSVTLTAPVLAQTVTLAQGVDPESLDPAVDTLITSVSVMMN